MRPNNGRVTNAVDANGQYPGGQGQLFPDVQPRKPKTLTSWLPQPEPEPTPEPEPEEPKAKGMKSGQKARISSYLEDFRKKNGGCLLTEDAKIAEFGAFPEITATSARLYLYGLCTTAARQHNSDELAEAKLFEIARSGNEVPPEQARLVVVEIDNDNDTETRKYY